MFFAKFLFCLCGAMFEFIEDPAEATSSMKRVFMLFWILACSLTVAGFVSVLVLIGLEYRELIDLVSHDYKMFMSLCRKQRDNEEVAPETKPYNDKREN